MVTNSKAVEEKQVTFDGLRGVVVDDMGDHYRLRFTNNAGTALITTEIKLSKDIAQATARLINESNGTDVDLLKREKANLIGQIALMTREKEFFGKNEFKLAQRVHDLESAIHWASDHLKHKKLKPFMKELYKRANLPE